MHRFLTSLVATAGLVLAAPAAGEDAQNGLSYDVAMDCGVAHAFIAGAVLKDDPDLSAELERTATVWMAMAYQRFGGDEDQFEQSVNQRAQDLSDELAGMLSEAEVEEFFAQELDACEFLQVAHEMEFSEAETLVQGAE